MVICQLAHLLLSNVALPNVFELLSFPLETIGGLLGDRKALDSIIYRVPIANKFADNVVRSSAFDLWS